LSKSPLEQLPQIVANGKRQAEQIMESTESAMRLGLHTREAPIPSKDTNIQSIVNDTD